MSDKSAGGAAREEVLNILMEWEKTGIYADRLLSDYLGEHRELSRRDRAFMNRLLQGVVGNKIYLDHVLESMVSSPGKKMRPALRNIFRMGIYQLLFMDSVPAYAVMDESRKLAVKHGLKNLKGFLEGVLRQVERRREEILKNRDELTADIRYSIPQWIYSSWQKQYGGELSEIIAAAGDEIRPITLRIRGGAKACEVSERISEISPLRPVEHLPNAYYMDRGVRPEELPGYCEGYFVVQDMSSMLAVEAAGLKGDEFVMDICAAPGGKSLLAADKLETGKVLAGDISPERLEKLRENIKRTGITNIQTVVRDACAMDDEHEASADVVFADVPCSGLGVLGHKKDVKYRITPETVKELVILQKKILTSAVRYLKPGGILIYSTCTVSAPENREMAAFIVSELGLVPEDMTPFLPESLFNTKKGSRHSECTEKYMEQALASVREGWLQLLPGVFECDGFFIARFRKP